MQTIEDTRGMCTLSREATIHLTHLESWLLDDMIRHTWNDESRPIGKGLLLKVIALIREFEQRSLRPHPPATLPIGLNEDECWAIDYHVRRNLRDTDGRPVGKELLLKSFDALLSICNATITESFAMAIAEEPIADEESRQRKLRRLAEFLEQADEPDIIGQ